MDPRHAPPRGVACRVAQPEMQYAIERQLTIAIENQPARLAAIARVMALSAHEARELKARGREPVLTKTRWLLL